MFDFVKTITLDIFNIMCAIYDLALRNAKIHVYTIDCGNITADVKKSVDKSFSLRATLSILCVNPNYSHVGLGESFNNLGLRSKNNIIEYVSSLNDLFNNIRYDWDVSVFNVIRNAQDLEIQFELQES